MNTRNRRNFLKIIGLGSVFFSFKGLEAKKNNDGYSNSFSKAADEMRPDEIIAALDKSSLAFVPVSPVFEWHSYHLPLGTDAIICEELAKNMARIKGGIWFKPLPLGLESWRTKEQKEKWGLRQEEEVFGLNFPGLPLKGEYCEADEFKKIVVNRIKPLIEIGIKHIFIINHHGGNGQNVILSEIAKKLSTERTKIHSVKPSNFNDLKKEDGWEGVGAHAGYQETTWVLAFRPELVDLSKLKQGELSVRETGILNPKPIIEEQWNPVNVSMRVANLLRVRVVGNFGKYITQVVD